MEMASDNQITIVGNLTDDPELRYTPNGAAVVNFSVAAASRIRDKAGGWKYGDLDMEITIVGNLTDDPELRYTPNGAAVVNFSVAVTPRIRDEGGGWKDGDLDL